MAKEFQGKVALITGGASGIGQATAIAFAREGASVVVSDVVDAGGETTAKRIRDAGGVARALRCDVSSAAEVQALVQGTVAAFGRLDVAFNNAGIEGAQGPVATQSPEAFAKVIAVNLTGAFLCMRYELEQMEKQGSGAIINNASILGTVGFAGAGAYTAAKHGLLGLTKVAALESAAKGIRVNAVCPGFIATPMLERAGLLSDPKVRQGIEALHPVKRLGTSEEIAEAVLFLASPRASFITGHPMLVDGGYVSQ
ncbi:MAG: SDR family oxidoreductase [Myxococcaceae bacterium]|nr:SDR family oxidoreductase [Myxococcaceae bacterium]